VESGPKIDPATGVKVITRLGFEKIYKTQGIFKIKERFQVIL